MPTSFDPINCVIAVIALIIALYSIHYTRKFNRRKLLVSPENCLTDLAGPVVHCFELRNASPVTITIIRLKFLDLSGNTLTPIRHEPTQTFTITGPFGTRIPDILDQDRFEYHMKLPCTLNPYESESLGYYFPRFHREIKVVVTSSDRINGVHKERSFVIHFDEHNE